MNNLVDLADQESVDHSIAQANTSIQVKAKKVSQNIDGGKPHKLASEQSLDSSQSPNALLKGNKMSYPREGENDEELQDEP